MFAIESALKFHYLVFAYEMIYHLHSCLGGWNRFFDLYLILGLIVSLDCDRLVSTSNVYKLFTCIASMLYGSSFPKEILQFLKISTVLGLLNLNLVRNLYNFIQSYIECNLKYEIMKGSMDHKPQGQLEYIYVISTPPKSLVLIICSQIQK